MKVPSQGLLCQVIQADGKHLDGATILADELHLVLERLDLLEGLSEHLHEDGHWSAHVPSLAGPLVAAEGEGRPTVEEEDARLTGLWWRGAGVTWREKWSSPRYTP